MAGYRNDNTRPLRDLQEFGHSVGVGVPVFSPERKRASLARPWLAGTMPPHDRYTTTKCLTLSPIVANVVVGGHELKACHHLIAGDAILPQPAIVVPRCDRRMTTNTLTSPQSALAPPCARPHVDGPAHAGTSMHGLHDTI